MGPSVEFLAPFAALGFQGLVIGFLLWALVKKDKKVEDLQEARVVDQKERASDNLRAAAVIEQLNSAARVREEANDSRWKVLETANTAIHATAKAVDTAVAELAAIRRTVDVNTARLDATIRGVRGDGS